MANTTLSLTIKTTISASVEAFKIILEAGTLIVQASSEVIGMISDIMPKIKGYISTFRGAMSDIIADVEAFIMNAINILKGTYNGTKAALSSYGLTADPAAIAASVENFLSPVEEEQQRKSRGRPKKS